MAWFNCLIFVIHIQRLEQSQPLGGVTANLPSCSAKLCCAVVYVAITNRGTSFRRSNVIDHAEYITILILKSTMMFCPDRMSIVLSPCLFIMYYKRRTFTKSINKIPVFKSQMFLFTRDHIFIVIYSR